LEVADTVGINSEVYGRLKRAVMAPSIGTLRRLCVALGISADEAFRLEPFGEPPAALEAAQPDDTLIRRLLRRVSVLSPRSVRTLVLVAANMPSDTWTKRAR